MVNKFKTIKVGDKAKMTHIITEDDVNNFVKLTGDDNRLHVDKEYAKSTEFKIPVVHGMLGASFISTIIGTKLPGDGALWYSQTLEFHKPVRINDEITIEAEVISKNNKNNSVELKTNIYNQHNQIVTSGNAKVKIINQAVVEAKSINEKKEKEKLGAILIIGSTGGIGKELAIKLSENGYDIILHYNSNNSKANEIKSICELNNVKCLIVKANLINQNEIDFMLDRIYQNNIQVYGFVNCATIKIPVIKFSEITWNYFEDQININIKANFFLLKSILSKMTSLGNGRVILITSNVVDMPVNDWSHYITAKNALTGFAKALALEYSSKGITVNCVSPSMIDTDLLSEIPQKVKMLVEARTPVKRLCTPIDVANAVLFLLSENSSFITGETLRLNGGQNMI
jgi:3-oxoacyl-[acyl-carrier protein] reductase